MFVELYFQELYYAEAGTVTCEAHSLGFHACHQAKNSSHVLETTINRLSPAGSGGSEALEPGSPVGLSEPLGRPNGYYARAAASHVAAVVAPVAVVKEEHLLVRHARCRS